MGILTTDAEQLHPGTSVGVFLLLLAQLDRIFEGDSPTP